MRLQSCRYTAIPFFLALALSLTIGCGGHAPWVLQMYPGQKLQSQNTALIAKDPGIGYLRLDGRSIEENPAPDWIEILPGKHTVDVYLHVYERTPYSQRRIWSRGYVPLVFKAEPHRIYMIKSNHSNEGIAWTPEIVDITEKLVSGKPPKVRRENELKSWYENKEGYKLIQPIK